MTQKNRSRATSLGQRIIKARETMDLTTAQLARRLGVGTSTLASWESDRSDPRANKLVQLAAMMNVSLSWLLSGRGAGPSEHSLERDLSHLRVSLDALRSEADNITAQIDHIMERLNSAPEGRE